MEKNPVRAAAIETGLGFSARAELRPEKSEKVPCNRNGISARAETLRQDGCRYEVEAISVE